MIAKFLGICVIIGIVYAIAQRIGLTTFIKGLVGFIVLGFLGYCAFKALPDVWEFVKPWTGIVIVILVIFGIYKLIRG